MESILNRIKQWIVGHKNDIILLIVVILVSLLSFALGFILAREGEKEPIKIENGEKNSLSRSYNYRW
jgi:Tfp pilus assembly protein PilO